MLLDPDATGLLFAGRDVSTTGRLAPFSLFLATSTPHHPQKKPNLHLMTTISKRLLFPTESTMKKSSLFGFPRVRLRKRIDDTCYLPVFSV